MQKVADLKQRFVTAGGSARDFEELTRGGIALENSAPQNGATRPDEARGVAERGLVAGTLIEYLCYDNRGRDQGSAVVRFERWVDSKEFTFCGVHFKASDDYYEWWAGNELQGVKDVYHLCMKPKGRCKVQNPSGGDVIHIDKWQLSSPMRLIGYGYASEAGYKHLEDAANDHLAQLQQLPPPVFPPDPRTGVQAVVARG